jgi:flagellar protein FlaG
MRVEGVSIVTAVKSTPRVGQQVRGTGLKDFDANDQSMVKADSSLSVNVNHQDIMYAVKQANKALEGTNRRFEYSIHEQTNTIVVKVIDTETNEVIREIPPEKILNLIAKLWELAGIIVDEKV